MYEVRNENQDLMAVITEPRYIKQSENGTFIEATEEDAKGVSIKSIPYQLIGREQMTGTVDSVSLFEVEGGDLFLENKQEINNIEDATCELSETTEESIAALEQAICELSEEIYGGE